MREKYDCVPYKQLQESQLVMAFGCHATQWDFDLMGDPTYGFVADDTQCEWKPDEDWYGCISWDTSCGQKYQFEIETPKDHGYRFCPSCGKTLNQLPFPPEEDLE